MATTTVSDFVASLAREIEVYEDQGGVQDYYAKLAGWTNDVYKEILSKRKWTWRYTSESFAQVIGQAGYSLQNGGIEVRTAFLGPTVNKPLIYTTVRDLTERGYDLTQSGEPIFFFDTGYNATTQKYTIQLFPVPVATTPSVYVYEMMAANDLALGSTIPLPEHMMAVLKHGTRVFMYRDDGDFDNADRYEGNYEKALRAEMTQDGLKEADSTMQDYADVPGAGGIGTFPVRLPSNWPKIY